MKRVVIVLALFSAMIAVWFVAFRNHEATTKPKPQPVEKEKKLITLNTTKRELTAEQKNIAHEDDPKGPLTLSGQVIGVDGKFAPGATVSINSNPPREAITDERGWFFFEGLLGRYYYIEAKKENAFVGPLGVNLNSITDPVELRLKSGSALEILVLDEETTQPIPNVSVVVETITKSKATTDSKGVAHFFGFGVNYANAYVDAPGYSQLRTEIFIKGAPDQTQKEIIYAASGSMISGVVLDPSGNPVAGANVLATTISTDYTFLREGDSAETDPDGKFVIPAVPPGGYRLYATHPKFRAVLSEAFDVEEKTPSTGHSIQLQTGSVLAGKVVDQDDKPVPFAGVTLSYERLSMDSTEYWDYKKSLRDVFCDERGEFSFEGVAPGKIELRASAEESTEAVMKLSLTENESKQDLILLLDPGEQISGRVVTDKGEPLAEIEVYASKKEVEGQDGLFESGMSYSRAIYGQTDTNGEFLLRGLEPGEYFLSAAVVYTSEQAQSYREDIDPTAEQKAYASGSTGVTLVMKKLDAATIKGNVVFEGGGSPSSFIARVGAAERYIKDSPSFLFEDVSVEYAYAISIEGDEFLGIQKTLKLEPNQVLDLGTITVKRGRIIEGQVVNGRSTPIAGAQINIVQTSYGEMPDYKPEDWMPSYTQKTARSDQDGRFILEGVSSTEDYSINASHPHKGTSKDEKIPKGTNKATVTLTMRDGGILTGKVTRDGKPCRANINVIEPLPKEESEGFTGAYVPSSTSGGDGIYRMERIPEGKYEVEFYRYAEDSVSSEPIFRKTITIKEGETTTLDADLPVRPTLRIEVNTAQTKDYWWFQLFKGSHTLKTAGDLEDFFSKLYEENPENSDGLYHYGAENYYEPGIQAEFIDVAPQTYTACVGVSPSTYVEEAPDAYRKQKIYCQVVKISPSPERQTISITP